jgi:hypothetical protein
MITREQYFGPKHHTQEHDGAAEDREKPKHHLRL